MYKEQVNGSQLFCTKAFAIEIRPYESYFNNGPIKVFDTTTQIRNVWNELGVLHTLHLIHLKPEEP